MSKVAEKHRARLSDIKDKVRASHDYFRDNSNRFYEFIRFIYKTTLDDVITGRLSEIKKPAMEFPVLEAMVSRQLSGFMMQEPSLDVNPADGIQADDLTKDYIQFVEVLTSCMREIVDSNNHDNVQAKIFEDMLSGGFCVAEVFTEYVSPKSFEQGIFFERVFDSTLTGFDPLAHASHKGDGNYCFKVIPQSRKWFEHKYGSEITSQMSFIKDFEGFNWSFKTQKEDIVLLVEFYEKQPKRVKIVKLSNGNTVEKKKYERFMDLWNDAGIIMQPPIIIEERWTDIDVIHKYTLCENEVLEHIETNFKYLPLVFFDGHSKMMRDTDQGAAYQMTRPYVYHARDIQKGKNLAGQTLFGDIEATSPDKFMACVEAIDQKNMHAWLNPQANTTLLYNAFYNKNPEYPLPAPQKVPRNQIPPVVESIFFGSDRITQTIMGNYDNLPVTNQADVSGVAIDRGQMQSSAAAAPYLDGYINGLNQVAQIILDLIPKYYVTPRTIPIKGLDGKRDYQMINYKNQRSGEQLEGSIDFRFDSNNLKVSVSAGVNNAIQKDMALEKMGKWMQNSQIFNEFANTKCLGIMVDNLDIRGQTKMKQLAEEFMVEIDQAKKQAQEQAQNQTDPMLEVAKAQVSVEESRVQAEYEVGMAKAETERVKAESAQSTDVAKIALEQERLRLYYLEIMAKVEREDDKARLERNRVESEIAKEAIEVALDIAKQHRDALYNQ